MLNLSAYKLVYFINCTQIMLDKDITAKRIEKKSNLIFIKPGRFSTFNIIKKTYLLSVVFEDRMAKQKTKRVFKYFSF